MDKVDSDDLRYDANECWALWSTNISTIQTSLEVAGNNMDDDDWSGQPSAQEVRIAWARLDQHLQQHYADGSTTMTDIACQLLQCAINAEIAEGAAQEEIDEIQKEMDEL
ncbi:MAG: hypothetical protein FWF02_10215 [Micrococcales bacterium]|nr:hypothetical protein [Micrococcales bacterium]MCL2668060.1 hypothetical protein [Micrococcales bacterium]